MRDLTILALLALMASAAAANPVILSLDEAGTQVSAFTPFNLQVIGVKVGQVVGWEIGMEVSPLYTVLARTVNNGPGVNPMGDDNYIIGLGGCYGTEGEDYLFISYKLGYFAGEVAPFDETFCLVVPNGGEPPASGFLAYRNCENELIELTPAEAVGCEGEPLVGCALLNPSCSAPPAD